MTDDERIIRIETKIAYQEDTIQSLNEVVCRQQKQIEQLQATCKVLIERLDELSDANNTAKPVDEIPPHY